MPVRAGAQDAQHVIPIRQRQQGSGVRGQHGACVAAALTSAQHAEGRLRLLRSDLAQQPIQGVRPYLWDVVQAADGQRRRGGSNGQPGQNNGRPLTDPTVRVQRRDRGDEPGRFAQVNA